MLELKNISKTFFPGTINEKKALRGVDLHMETGDFITIIGGNGAGKSTLLNSIAGVFPIDEGSITIDDVELTQMPEHQRARYIGRVFQDPMMGTAAGMMIEENLAIASRRGKRPGLSWALKEEERSHFRELLKELDLGLEDRLTARVGLLLLDEHTAALDPKTAEKVLALTQKVIARDHLTSLMITHNMRDALRFGNRLVMMNAGRIVVDVGGEEKKRLTIPDLLNLFEKASGEELDNDRMILG